MKTSALAACLATLLASSTALASAPCFTAAEQRASMVRQLQTELMVAALKCAGHPADLAGRYNTFIRKFGGEIGNNAEVLRGYFKRSYGGGHARKMDAYVTSLANDAVMRTIGETSFCENTAQVFDKVLAVESKDLEHFATTAVTPRQSVLACANN